MEKRKYLGSANQNYIKSFKSEIITVNQEGIKGYASFMKIEEIHRPYMIGDFCLYNIGYSEIGFLPDDENWCLWAFYNENGDITEWYFDITKKNSVDDDGRPYCDDLYLDAVLLPDGQILILDEDELKDALDDIKITQSEFDMAYDVLASLKEKKILNVPYMEMLCSKLRPMFTI